MVQDRRVRGQGVVRRSQTSPSKTSPRVRAVPTLPRYSFTSSLSMSPIVVPTPSPAALSAGIDPSDTVEIVCKDMDGNGVSPHIMPRFLKSFGDWHIRSDITYLDNGAFGACPKVIVENQRNIGQQIEENPHHFYERLYVSLWDSSKTALADFIHVDPKDLALVPGATHGMNVVIQSLNFDADDEILTTNHAYSSVQLALEYVARRDQARLLVVDIPLEVSSHNCIRGRILSAVTPRTKLVVLDHIPSRSGLIFPVKDLVQALDARGIDTLIDGAHVPGQIPLDVTDINAAYYVANCHKWMCTPRGVGFVHVRRDKAQTIKPLVFGRSPYVVDGEKYSALEHAFGWMGTACPSAALSLPASIHFLRTLVPGGYEALSRRNHDLAVLARRIVCRALGTLVPCPDHMIGAMATIPLHDSVEPQREGMLRLQRVLWDEFKVAIPVYSWPAYPKRVIRLSVQAYNSLDQYLFLADCLRTIFHHERQPSCLVFNVSHWPPRCLKSSESLGEGASHRSLDRVNGIDFDGFCLKKPYKDIDNPKPTLLFSLAGSRLRRIIANCFHSGSIEYIIRYPDIPNNQIYP